MNFSEFFLFYFFIKALIILSISINSIDSQTDCDGNHATTAYTIAYPGAKVTECGAACSASFIAINAVKSANVTACNKAVSDAANACQNSSNTCARGLTAQKQACNLTLTYEGSAENDSITQTNRACTAAKTGTTACNAAYSNSYINCNTDHKTDYSSCNTAVDNFVQLCIAQNGTSAICSSEYLKAQTSCQASGAKANNLCAGYLIDAQKSC